MLISAPPREPSTDERHYSRGHDAAPTAAPAAGKSRLPHAPRPVLSFVARIARSRPANPRQGGSHEARPVFPERPRPRASARSSAPIASWTSSRARPPTCASRGVVRAGAIAAALFPHDSTRGVPRGRQRQPGHAGRHDGRRQERQVRARVAPARDGAAARPHRGSREVHLHRPQLQGPRGGDEQSRPQGAAGLPEVEQCHRRPRRAGPAPARREDARLGGGAGRGHRPHGAVREAGAGARLRLRLHHHQRRERARLPVPHDPVGRGQDRRHAGAGGPLHRGPRGDPRPACPRPQDLGQRHPHAERRRRGTSSSTWATSSST